MVVQNFFSPCGSNLSDGGNLEKKILVGRRHRRDEEAFYLPCVLSLGSVEAFWGAGLGWLLGRKALRPYNYERVHSGYGLAGRTLDGCGVALGFAGSAYVGLMPVILLDEMVLDWSRAGLPAVNDVLAHYIARGCSKNRFRCAV